MRALIFVPFRFTVSKASSYSATASIVNWSTSPNFTCSHSILLLLASQYPSHLSGATNLASVPKSALKAW